MTSLPSNTQAERAVLGAMLLNSEVIDDVTEILGTDGDAFTVDAHAAVHEAITTLHGRSRRVDELTVYEDLKSNGKAKRVGGATFVSALTTATPTSANATSYASIVAECRDLRNLILACRKIEGEAGGDVADVAEFIEGAEADLIGVLQHREERKRRGTLIEFERGIQSTLAKNREGTTGQCYLEFDRARQLFTDPISMPTEPYTNAEKWKHDDAQI
ncbi:MAG: hypothetical protein GWP08_14320 [Nitrospiraceae bacterium]|nr:hypothetical protein [Nitrospiraceae bacterium]